MCFFFSFLIGGRDDIVDGDERGDAYYAGGRYGAFMSMPGGVGLLVSMRDEVIHM